MGICWIWRILNWWVSLVPSWHRLDTFDVVSSEHACGGHTG
jgi:hypothetical protein